MRVTNTPYDSASPQKTGIANGPDATLMVPVTTLASYMAQVEGEVLPAVFVDDGLIIVEDFAPYVFSGKDAAAQWDAGFRWHAIPFDSSNSAFVQRTISIAQVTAFFQLPITRLPGRFDPVLALRLFP